MKENRKYPRVKKKVKSEVHSEEGMMFSTTTDMSNGGIFISTPEPMKIGSEVKLSIKIPDSEGIELSGVVKWISNDEVKDKKSGMGIEFKDMSENTKKIIKYFLS